MFKIGEFPRNDAFRFRKVTLEQLRRVNFICSNDYWWSVQVILSKLPYSITSYRPLLQRQQHYLGIRLWVNTAFFTYVIEFRGKRVGSIRMAFVRAVKRSGIGKDFRIHDLRHIYATYMLNNWKASSARISENNTKVVLYRWKNYIVLITIILTSTWGFLWKKL